MYLRFLSGRYAGKVRNVAPVPGRAMLADGRAELEYPIQLPASEPVAVEAVHAKPVRLSSGQAPEPHEVPGKKAGSGSRERQR
jgi:hypothetical protein